MKTHQTKLGIVEFAYHTEVLQTVLDVIDTNEFDVTLFTTDSLIQNLDVPSDIQVVTNDRLNNSVQSKMMEQDVLLFNTVVGHFAEYGHIMSQVPSIVRIHNVNTWFGPQQMSSPNSLYELRKFISHYMRKELFGSWSRNRQKLIPSVAQFILPTNQLVNEAQRLTGHGRPIYQEAIPLQYSRQQVGQGEAGVLVIPGRIDPRKKDYQFALDVLKDVTKSQQVILLGSPEGRYGREMISKFRHELAPKHTVVAYDQFVPTEEFNQWMKKASLLFLPIIRETSFTMYREYYGQTKESGGVNDALTWGKPFLIPEFYQLNSNIKSLSMNYDSKQKAVQIIEKFERPLNYGSMESSRDGLTNQYTRLIRSIL